MASTGGTQGGPQHGKPGEQPRKQASTPPGKSASSGAGREKTAPGAGGGPEQHGKPGHQNPKGS